MIRFLTLSIITALALSIALGGAAGIFAGVILLAVGVAGFGLLIVVCTEFLREN